MVKTYLSTVSLSKQYSKEFANKKDATKFYRALRFSKNIAWRTCSGLAGENCYVVRYCYYR